MALRIMTSETTKLTILGSDTILIRIETTGGECLACTLNTEQAQEVVDHITKMKG